MLDSLAYRTARNHIHSFNGESEELMARHEQAMECLDCQDFLQLGIDAFNWLTRADAQVRKAIFSGKMDHRAEVDEAIDVLYKTWLKPCDFAEQWIAVQTERAFDVDNLADFRRCVDEARAIVRDNREVAGDIERKRDQAVAAQRSGETLDWDVSQ